jgi:hypothetical protein
MTTPRPQVWRTLALVYRRTDARWGRLLPRRSRREMSPEELATIRAVLARVPAAVAAWSEGNAALDPLDVVEVERPLGSLSESGGGRWWAAPPDCRQEIEAHVRAGAYDAIYAIWPSDGRVPLCGWGCTIGPSDAARGAGFSSIPSDHWQSLASDPDPEQGYVHEWLHQVEATYRELGVGEETMPPLHDAFHSSCRPATEPPFGLSYADYHNGGARTWRPWYRDYMTGGIRRPDGSGCLGLTPELWALRRRR